MYDSANPTDDIAVNRAAGCRRAHIGPRHLAEAATIEYYFGGPFRLRDNLAMSADEYRDISALLALVRRAVDDASSFIATENLPREIFDPQNQWAIMLQDGGVNRSTYLPFRQPGEASTGATMRPQDAWSNLNWTRILSPFTGYYLAYLDRLDQGGRFPQPYPRDVLEYIWSDVLPDDLPDVMERYLDHHQRLAWTPEQHFIATRNMPAHLVADAPPRGGEVGLMINGRIVNPDTLLVQGRLNAMYAGGVIGLLQEKVRAGRRLRVLEIGPGYGAMARTLGRIFAGGVDYVMVDLPPMLHYPAVYLSLSGVRVDIATADRAPDPAASHWLIPNYLAPRLAEQSVAAFDLVINTMSMNEMSLAQVRYYAEFIRRSLAPDGIFYEENAVGLDPHVDCRAEFHHHFPFRRHVRSYHVAAGLGQPFIWSNRYIPQIFDRWDWSLP